MYFFLNDPATPEIYTLSLHDALPILATDRLAREMIRSGLRARLTCIDTHALPAEFAGREFDEQLLSDFESIEDRKSTRLNSSHEWISYAVFCLKKKKINNEM